IVSRIWPNGGQCAGTGPSPSDRLIRVGIALIFLPLRRPIVVQCKNASRPAEKNAKLSTRSKIGKVPAKEKHAAPLLPGALDTDFASFLAGDQRAGAALYERLKGPLLSMSAAGRQICPTRLVVS